MNVCDPSLELIDPSPDVHKLFVEYDNLFFNGVIQKRTIVKWSKRLTLCAGICKFDGQMNEICLSTPLLSLRPRSDTINTLLHEMIHAYLFLTQRIQDRDGHGPHFQAHMHRLNKITGSNITIYHTFHDEVDAQRTHIWKCNGPCVKRPPFFGIVKRSMNRAPGKNDTWYARHQQTCGGTWTKISEPPKKEKSKKSTKKVKTPPKSPKNQPKIDQVFKKPSSDSFPGEGHSLGGRVR